ncbi:MAG: cyclic nucleotide-binding domain-containing protein, partial [Vicinamibacterales bacterium]
DPAGEQQRYSRHIAAIPVFSGLGGDVHAALASAARERLFGRDELVVKEGDGGASMFLVIDGAVAITVGLEKREVAVIGAGGYFGEMSLLTGDRRSATVTARGDCTLLEISADAFGAHVRSHPSVLEGFADAAIVRRGELEAVKSAPGVTPAAAKASLLARMQKFFRL